MRKETFFAFAAFVYVSLSAFTAAFAGEDAAKMVLIRNEKMDVTGDGMRETILLKGIPYQKGNSFMKGFVLEIKANRNQNFHVNLDSGFDPFLHMEDLNQDGVKDVFVSIHTDRQSEETKSFLFSLKDLIFTDIAAPQPLLVKSMFVNGYKAIISTKSSTEKHVMDLIDKKNIYDELGLYRNGKVNEPTELMVSGYTSLIPALDNGGRFMLKGTQKVNGVSEKDRIAVVKSEWKYVDGKWKLAKVRVIPIDQHQQAFKGK